MVRHDCHGDVVANKNRAGTYTNAAAEEHSGVPPARAIALERLRNWRGSAKPRIVSPCTPNTWNPDAGLRGADLLLGRWVIPRSRSRSADERAWEAPLSESSSLAAALHAPQEAGVVHAQKLLKASGSCLRS